MQASALQSHEPSLYMSPSTSPFRSQGSPCVLPFLKVWLGSAKGFFLAQAPHPPGIPGVQTLSAQPWSRKPTVLTRGKALESPRPWRGGTQVSQPGLAGELAKPWPCA